MFRPRLRSRAQRWLSAPAALFLIASMALVPASSVIAAEPTDMVLEWNVNAVTAIGNAPTATPPGLGQPPPLAPIHIAMVHVAMYDAVNAIDGTRQPYLGGLNAPSSASQAAAAAAAAHGVLIGLTPATLPQVTASLDALYATSLAKIPGGTPKTAGIAVGEAAATAMLANRAGDGRFGTKTFAVGTQPGEWRLVPPLNANVFAWVSDVRPFSLESAGQFRTAGPFDLDSKAYAREFNEVKAIGGATSTRTPAQAELASFVSVSPVGMINRAFREIATARGLSTAQQARLFAMTSMSAADALIGCWENKDHWLFWRPQTAIQEAAADGNPATEADATWTSLIPTPGYPDNPSGYNCFAAGMMQAARAFFRTDKISFDLTSPTATPITRHYHRFTGVVRDAIEGRILIGLHFRSADVQGAWLGRKVAQWVAKHEFGPAH
jgi:hypothetical protein